MGAKGAAKTGGRQKGSLNKRTTLMAVEAEAAVAGEMAEITPLAFLLKVMRDENEDMDRRVLCGKAAAQYMHPSLKSVEMSGPDGGPIKYKVNLRLGSDGN
jgi:hypothetical protein